MQEINFTFYDPTPLNISLTVEKLCGIDDKDLRLIIKLVVGVVVMGINVLPNHQILATLQANSTANSTAKSTGMVIFYWDGKNTTVSQDELVNLMEDYLLL